MFLRQHYVLPLVIALGYSIPLNTNNKYLEQVSAAGLNVIRAYGNATTDIEGFRDGGVPLSEIYVIGENAGAMGSQGILEDDYWSHLDDVVNSTQA